MLGHSMASFQQQQLSGLKAGGLSLGSLHMRHCSEKQLRCLARVVVAAAEGGRKISPGGWEITKDEHNRDTD